MAKRAGQNVHRAGGDAAASAQEQAHLTVLCLDDNDDRAAAIVGAMARCDSRFVVIRGALRVRHVATTTCMVALVPLDDPPTMGARVIDRLRRDGFQVLAYASGLDTWPVGKRC